MTSYPVAIIGGGPVGLAAAAHLIARGETPIVFEAGAHVGAHLRQWGHVRMFSPWRYVVDTASVRLLDAAGWVMPPADDLPTGEDLLTQYLEPLAALPEMRDHIQTGARVVSVSRRGIDKMKDAGRSDAPFVLRIAHADGRETQVLARAVIDASGTWSQPNPLGADGLPALGEARAAERLTYGIPDVTGADRARFAGKRVMVVGSGHSAINALLGLVALRETAPETQIIWAMRGKDMRQVYGGGTNDALSARGSLGTRMAAAVDSGAVTIESPLRITAVSLVADGVQVCGDSPDGERAIIVDEVIVTTGARPDLAMLRELRLNVDPSLETTPALAPLIDPNLHSCGTVPPHGEAELRQPEQDFYIVGMKSYGRAPTFLLLTGYEQVRSIAAALTGDHAAAAAVELVLPETGVCSTDLGDGNGCCAAPVNAAVTLSLDAIPVAGISLTSIGGFAPTLTVLAADPVSAAACCGPDCCTPAAVETVAVSSAACCDDTCCP